MSWLIAFPLAIGIVSMVWNESKDSESDGRKEYKPPIPNFWE